MTDEPELLQRVLDNPDEDTHRLAYADFLDEQSQDHPVRVPCTMPDCKEGMIYTGKDGMKWIRCARCDGSGTQVDYTLPRRAEFIRVQCELARLGPPHKQDGFGDDEAVILHSGGPDYWQYTRGPIDLSPGDRVDVRCAGGRRMEKIRVKHGLLVTRVEGGIVTVKRDERSVPWGGEALAKRSKELSDLHADSWALPLAGAFGFPVALAMYAGTRDVNANPRYYHVCSTHASEHKIASRYLHWTFRRGFVDAITCSFIDWMKYADVARKVAPIREVAFSDADMSNMRTVYDDRTKQFHFRDDPHRRKVSRIRVDALGELGEGSVRHCLLELLFPGISFGYRTEAT